MLLTVKNSGVNTVNLNFTTSDLVENIFTIKDCGGNIVKTITQVSLAPGITKNTHTQSYAPHKRFYTVAVVSK